MTTTGTTRTYYKIRMKGRSYYSHGIIRGGSSDGINVKWSARGKEWPTKASLQKHLMKCISLGGIPSTWEVIEYSCTELPVADLDKWFDAKMLMGVLKL